MVEVSRLVGFDVVVGINGVVEVVGYGEVGFVTGVEKVLGLFVVGSKGLIGLWITSLDMIVSLIEMAFQTCRPFSNTMNAVIVISKKIVSHSMIKNVLRLMVVK